MLVVEFCAQPFTTKSSMPTLTLRYPARPWVAAGEKQDLDIHAQPEVGRDNEKQQDHLFGCMVPDLRTNLWIDGALIDSPNVCRVQSINQSIKIVIFKCSNYSALGILKRCYLRRLLQIDGPSGVT
jgi:hypothetical protein